MPPSQRPLEFFVDRSLGRRDVPSALRAAGLRLRTMAEAYGAREQSVGDEEWLARAGQEGWIVLAKDKRFRYRPAESAAIRQYAVKAFVLTSGNLSSEEQVRRFLENLAPIRSAAAEPGPFVYAVRAHRIEKLWPPPAEES